MDHCFARIILDHTIGVDTPWMAKIKRPAYRNMTKQQLKSSIELGTKILEGRVDLVALNNRSLELRGKKAKNGLHDGGLDTPNLGKRERDDHSTQQAKKTKLSQKGQRQEPSKIFNMSTTMSTPEDFTSWLKEISLCQKTPFQKKVLSAICQVPRGRYTTYALVSKHLSSSPRAVGNALRNNPFAPQVPCHRVLASGGGLAGFKGTWGRNGNEGLNNGERRRLLREEDVKFDGGGKVIGAPWERFRE